MHALDYNTHEGTVKTSPVMAKRCQKIAISLGGTTVKRLPLSLITKSSKKIGRRLIKLWAKKA